MNTYEVKCIAFPRPIVRIEATNSFAARKKYAAIHGCTFFECVAKRIRS